MTVTRLVRCRFCVNRVNPADAVIVDGEAAHEACAERWYWLVGWALGCSRAEGDQG